MIQPEFSQPPMQKEAFQLPAEITPLEFNAARRDFFSGIATDQMAAMRLHQSLGLWERVPNAEGGLKRDWGNLSEHCLVETARVRVIADLVGLSPEPTHELEQAAALHDVFKKGEVMLMKQRGLSQESYDEAGRESAKAIKAAGFSDTIVKLTGAVGHTTVREAEDLATKTNLTDPEKAWLIMHYVDDYTVDAQWAQQGGVIEGGVRINDLDRRMKKNEDNPRYAVMNQPDENGVTAYGEQRRVGRLVQERLTRLITDRIPGYVGIDPTELPVVVDQLIINKIEDIALSKRQAAA